MSNELELRHLESTEIRAVADNDVLVFGGYVAKFGERSQFMGFYEEIESRAFDNTLADGGNVFALYNHDWDKVLGSTQNGTLELSKDDIGLRFKLTPKANTSFMNDVKELVNSGELRGMSFGFTAKKDKWRTESGSDVRTLLEIGLKEITLTAIPAYDSSEVAIRSHESYKNELEAHRQNEKDKLKIKLELMD